MIALLQLFFNQQDDLLVFLMNGSRVNKVIPDDKFKDFDVAFFTNNISKYIENPSFIAKYFGEILIMTEPYSQHNLELFQDESDGKKYNYLIQFADGNRIDMNFFDIEYLNDFIESDSLTKVIADKTTSITKEIIPSDKDYWLKEPSSEIVNECIKEFWWVFLYVLKNIARKQYLLAQKNLILTRDHLIQMLAWQVGFEYGFDKSYGKEFTDITNYLAPKQVQLLVRTFNTADTDGVLTALQIMKELEEKTERVLADKLSIDFKDYSHVPREYLLSLGEDELAEFF